MSVLDFVAAQGWAMLQENVEELALIAARANETTPEMLEAYRAETLKRSNRAKFRDGVAIHYAEGPLFKRANLFVEFSGATSYQLLRQDLQTAVDDPKVHTNLFIIDSPGGEANGCDELAAAIRESSKIKPTIAYVSGLAASGGYWIASACSKIVVSEAALLGSIGVVLGFPNVKDARKIEFVSSQSPGKRPNPETEEGRTRIQSMVDELAEVFIGSVAENRGVSPEDVITKFGAGGLKVGAKAVAAGMADEVGQLEAVIASIVSSGTKSRVPKRSKGGLSMSENNNGPTAEEIAAQARTDAQNRVKTILSCDEAKLLPTAANFLAFDTTMSAQDSVKFLSAAKADFPKPGAAAQDQGDKPGQQQAGASFEERKEQTGALGLSEPGGAAEASKTLAKNAWGSAVKAVNGSIN